MSAVDPAADLAAKLVALTPIGGVVIALDTSLFLGPVRVVRAETPPQAIFCQNARGLRPTPYMGINKDFKQFQVLVTVRSEPAQFSVGEQLARDLMSAVQRTPPTGYITALLEQAGPDYLGEDDQRQHRWSFVVELWWKG